MIPNYNYQYLKNVYVFRRDRFLSQKNDHNNFVLISFALIIKQKSQLETTDFDVLYCRQCSFVYVIIIIRQNHPSSFIEVIEGVIIMAHHLLSLPNLTKLVPNNCVLIKQLNYYRSKYKTLWRPKVPCQMSSPRLGSSGRKPSPLSQNGKIRYLPENKLA